MASKPRPNMTLVDARTGRPVAWANSVDSLLYIASQHDAREGIFPKKILTISDLKVKSNYRIVFANIPQGDPIPTVFPTN